MDYAERLWYRQHLNIHLKIRYSLARIKQWYDYHHGHVYVAFSGGKDSLVLLHLVRRLYPNVLAVFVNTGLEFPETIRFVKKFDNVHILTPKIRFPEVIDRYGYPIISKETSQRIWEIRNTKSQKLIDHHMRKDMLPEKWRPLINAPFKISHKCCEVMKKQPTKKFEKETGLAPYLGLMARDSRLRRQTLQTKGCNAYDSKRPVSNPLAFWTDDDIWAYIMQRECIDYNPMYKRGWRRTGCLFCMFGMQREFGVTRFTKLKITHETLWKYGINQLKIGKVLDYMSWRY